MNMRHPSIALVAVVLACAGGLACCRIAERLNPYDPGADPLKVALPYFSIEVGTYETPQVVEILCNTDGVTIYYTTDGMDPTVGSAEYGGEITIGQTLTLKAFGVKEGLTSSDIVSAAFTITNPITPPPPPSQNKEITSFGFTTVANPALPANVSCSIAELDIAGMLRAGTNKTTLVATFATTGASVRVGSMAQVSGVTPNDFTVPVTYTVAAENGSTANYVVTLSENLELRYWGSTLANGTGSFDFGEVTSDGDSGARSGPAELAVFNTDSVAHTLGSVDVSSSDFDVSALSTMAIAAGEHATFTVSFDPVALGAKSGTVTVSNDDGGTLSLPVKGTGATPSAAAFVIHANVSEENVVMQCDADGNVRWVSTSDVSAYSTNWGPCIAVDSTNAVYIGGSGDTGTSYERDAYVYRLDSDGDVDTGWGEKLFRQPGEFDGDDYDVVRAMTTDAAGNLYVFAESRETSHATWWLKEFSSSGTEDTTNWDKWVYEQRDDAYGSDVMLDSTGAYVHFIGAWDETNTGDNRWWIKKYTTGGTLTWDVKFDHNPSATNNIECARSIATDSSGYLYVLGSSSAADNLHLLKKLDSSGAVISTGWPIEYDNGSNAVMSGRQGVAVDQATGDVYAAVSYSDGSRYTTRIRKYDSSGNETATGWDKVLDSSPYDNVSVSIMVDVSGNVYVAYYRGFYYDESGTLWDSRVAKYSSAGELLFDRGYDFSDVKIIDLALTN